MYCKNCGKEIDDKAAICIGCGCLTSDVRPDNTPKSNYNPFVGFILSLVTIVLSLFSSLITDSGLGTFFALLLPVGALICSAVEYKKAKQKNGKTSLSLAGIIISSIFCAFWALIFFLFFIVIVALI